MSFKIFLFCFLLAVGSIAYSQNNDSITIIPKSTKEEWKYKNSIKYMASLYRVVLTYERGLKKPYALEFMGGAIFPFLFRNTNLHSESTEGFPSLIFPNSHYFFGGLFSVGVKRFFKKDFAYLSISTRYRYQYSRGKYFEYYNEYGLVKKEIRDNYNWLIAPLEIGGGIRMPNKKLFVEFNIRIGVGKYIYKTDLHYEWRRYLSDGITTFYVPPKTNTDTRTLPTAMLGCNIGLNW